MKVFFISNWFPNKHNPAEGMFLKNAAEAIALYDLVTLFYADEDKSLAAGATFEQRVENKVSIHIAYYTPFKSPFKWLNMLLSSAKRIYYLHGLIRKEFATNRPDIFHFNIVSPSIVLMWYYKLRYCIPFVYSEHWDVPLRARRGLVKRWLPWRIGMKACASWASRVLVVSNAMRESFLHYGLASAVDIIPCVIVADNTNINDEKRLEGAKTLLHISTLSDAQKNISGMLRVIAALSASRSDFVLQILGHGKEFVEHQNNAKQLGILNKTVFFHGFVSEEEKQKWLEKSLCHILFSNFEGFSVVTAESIYYGRPVIVTRCGGPEDFVNESTGIIIEPGNEQELKEAIEYMLDHYSEFIPSILRSYAIGVFSASVVGEKHHDLYRAVSSPK
jgi:glycosyltransferase involved in cell wall biosynthesis